MKNKWLSDSNSSSNLNELDVFQRVLVVPEAEEDGGWCGGQRSSRGPAHSEAQVGRAPHILLATQGLPGHCSA